MSTLIPQDPSQADPSIVALMHGIKMQEGGGTINYNAIGDQGTAAGAGQWSNQPNGKPVPLAKGQIPSNFINAAKQYGLDPNDFSPANQNKVLYAEVAAGKNAGLTPEQILSAHNSGDKNAYLNPQRAIGTGSVGAYNVQTYVKQAMAYAQKFAQSQQQAPGTGSLIPTAEASTGQPQQDQGMSVGGFIGNAFNSAGNLIGGLANAAVHPIQTVQNVLGTAAGAIEKPFGVQNADTQKFDNILSYFGQRYGGSNPAQIAHNIIHTAYTDPVGVALDLSTLLDGVGAVAGGIGKISDIAKLSEASKAAELAKGADFIAGANGVTSGADAAANIMREGAQPGAMSQFGQTVGNIGNKINPINIGANAVGGALNFAGRNVVAPALGLGTGAGAGTIQEFWNSLTEGGEASKSALGAMRGAATPEDIVNLAKGSLGDIVAQRSSNYTDMLNTLKADSTVYNIAPIVQSFKEALQKFGIKIADDGTLDFSRSTIPDAAEQSKVTNIYSDLKSWGTQAGDNTAAGIDTLKRRIGANFSKNSDVRALVTQTAKSARKVLEDAPGYTKEMKNYANLTDQIEEIQRGLSLGDNAMVETSFKKLTSAFRQNNEYRKAFVQALDDFKGGKLSATIAGQQMNSILPRGLAKFTDTALGGGIIGGAPIIPALIAMAATSPRLVGEFLNAAALPIKTLNYVGKLLSKVVPAEKVTAILNIAKNTNEAQK